MIELQSDRVMVTFVNLARYDFESEIENCLECFIFIDIYFLAVLAVGANQPSDIDVTVTYDPAQIPVHLVVSGWEQIYPAGNDCCEVLAVVRHPFYSINHRTQGS